MYGLVGLVVYLFGSFQITAAMAKVAEAYGVQPIIGTMMHQMKRCSYTLRDSNRVVKKLSVL